MKDTPGGYSSFFMNRALNLKPSRTVAISNFLKRGIPWKFKIFPEFQATSLHHDFNHCETTRHSGKLNNYPEGLYKIFY